MSLAFGLVWGEISSHVHEFWEVFQDPGHIVIIHALRGTLESEEEKFLPLVHTHSDSEIKTFPENLLVRSTFSLVVKAKIGPLELLQLTEYFRHLILPVSFHPDDPHRQDSKSCTNPRPGHG